jgi:hypothetical protein
MWVQRRICETMFLKEIGVATIHQGVGIIPKERIKVFHNARCGDVECTVMMLKSSGEAGREGRKRR